MRIPITSLIPTWKAPFSAAAEAVGKDGPKSAREIAAERKIAETRDALAKLKDTRSQARDNAKAAARKKVDMLKQRLKALQFLGTSNSRAAARLIARLARELASAVKEYQSAGGSAADVGGSTPQPSASTKAAQENTPSGAAEAAAGEAQAAEAEARAERTADSRDADKTADADAPPADPYRLLGERRATEAHLAGAWADRDFLQDARTLASNLKAMLKRIEQESRREDGDSQTKAVLREVDAMLDKAQGANAAVPAMALSLTA